jgi:hypothetical protein
MWREPLPSERPDHRSAGLALVNGGRVIRLAPQPTMAVRWRTALAIILESPRRRHGYDFFQIITITNRLRKSEFTFSDMIMTRLRAGLYSLFATFL